MYSQGTQGQQSNMILAVLTIPGDICSENTRKVGAMMNGIQHYFKNIARVNGSNWFWKHDPVLIKA